MNESKLSIANEMYYVGGQAAFFGVESACFSSVYFPHAVSVGVTYGVMHGLTSRIGKYFGGCVDDSFSKRAIQYSIYVVLVPFFCFGTVGVFWEIASKEPPGFNQVFLYFCTAALNQMIISSVVCLLAYKVSKICGIPIKLGATEKTALQPQT